MEPQPVRLVVLPVSASQVLVVAFVGEQPAAMVVLPIPPKAATPPVAHEPRIRVTPVSWRAGIVRVERIDPDNAGNAEVEFVEEWTNS